jgi:DNA-binding response OmpR family regulator
VVDTAGSLAQARDPIARQAFDVAVFDVMLPDGNGFDLLAKLRASPEFATLPVVMLTAKTELADIHRGLALGADGYITKPYSKTQLGEVIAHVLKHGG